MTEQPAYVPYDDEIDLRELIQTLLDGWRWIALAAVGGALLALVVTLLMPVKYESAASIVLTKPDVVYNLDPRITTDLTVPPSEGLPGLVTSRGLLAEVLERAKREGISTGDLTPANFSNQIDASFSGTVLTLKVEDESPERSAALANAWADSVTQRLNDVYAGSYKDQSRFAEQAKDALEKWQETQQALVDFQSTSREAVLEERLGSLRDDLRSLLSARARHDMVVADARAILDRLNAGNQTRVAVQDSLASLALTLNAVGSSTAGLQTHAEGTVVGQAGSNVSHQFQLQVDAADLLASPAGEQKQFLIDLIDSVEKQSDDFEGRISAIEASIPDLQGQLSEAQEARHTIETRRDVAQNAYEALVNKAEESNLEARSGVVEIAQHADAPSQPVARRSLLVAAIAGQLSMLVAVAALALRFRWQHGKPDKETPQ